MNISEGGIDKPTVPTVSGVGLMFLIFFFFNCQHLKEIPYRHATFPTHFLAAVLIA